ncbi:protein-L-isoaspartate O-methyltransferase [Acidithiobacillus sp. IBUN Pt1247-S3]|uniref:protein-L-isoaspartate O-methyltransferase family protein n=1 Tax=Acidithiobacillus sp. IBUN Pt1247-S3 TaxID=3166642 RepID=UPI0034E41931
MHFDSLRQTMIDTQIRTWEVLDPEVLRVLQNIKREQFVPAQLQELAFADFEIPLGDGERMWTPKMEARVLQELEIQPQDKILEVGSGSGYFTALLASMGKLVHSVDDNSEFIRSAEGRLQMQGISNVQLHIGDASGGWATTAPYDVIVLTGSLPELPKTFLDQLNPGGRLVAILGQSPLCKVRRYRRSADGSLRSGDLFETDIPALRHPASKKFQF